MTPLERAARALVDKYPLDSGETPLEWQEALPVARAVIEAIREPSEAMMEMGAIDVPVTGAAHPDTNYAAEARTIYTSMIGALLEEGR